MIKAIKRFLGIPQNESTENDFSSFFRHASSDEKKKVLQQVVREANADQRETVRKYYQTAQ